MAESNSPSASAEERWIVHNSIESIRVEHRQTGTDTAETFVHLQSASGSKAVWRSETFKRVAILRLSWASIAEPAPGVREHVEAAEKFEKNNAKELAEYKRLKNKFDSTPEQPE